MTCAIAGADKFIEDATVTHVVVNGGSDTGNPGTTCIRLSAPTLAACVSGWVGIPNNNKLLIAAAMQAKASGSRVWLYYDDTAASQHCPALVWTPCAAVSLMLK